MVVLWHTADRRFSKHVDQAFLNRQKEKNTRFSTRQKSTTNCSILVYAGTEEHTFLLGVVECCMRNLHLAS